MPRVAKVLSAVAVAALRRKGLKGFYAVGGVPGLYLRVENKNSTQWMLRVVDRNGARRDIGLGPYPLIDLANARDAARDTHLKLRQGIDVVQERAQVRQAAAERRIAQEAALTFKQAAFDLHAVKVTEFKNAKHAQQWINTLETYAFPVIGHMDVVKIERSDVLEVLKPIWETKTETATRVRQRIEQVIDYASVVKNERIPDNPARWDGGLEHLLPKAGKIKKKQGKTRHHPALPWKRVPAFMADLRNRPRGSVAAKALELAILTASRSGEVRLATWREFDIEAGIWTVPASRMKAELEHRVPLVGRAIELVKSLPKGDPDDLLFPNGEGQPLSDSILSKLMKDMHTADLKAGGAGYLDPNFNKPATPHGTARSSFKDWHRDTRLTKYADEVSELQLAHVNDDKTRAAYARGELLDQRRELMGEWAEFLTDAQT